jgi:hypothetical protein
MTVHSIFIKLAIKNITIGYDHIFNNILLGGNGQQCYALNAPDSLKKPEIFKQTN